MPDKKTALLIFVLLSLVSLVYANHFENTFHYDDHHTVVGNPYIRELRNIPRFFADARTFSILPRNRTYRPLVSTSLAIDYWLGDGLAPVWFQLSTFCWFLLQLILMYALASGILQNRLTALFAVAWYGLHPAIAETVNYIIQRGDVYSTLGVVAALWIYAAFPRWRRFGLYLIPFAAGVLSKPPALIFPAILFMYLWLFEVDASKAALRCAPAVATAGALAYLTVAMTPPEFNPGVISAAPYRMTQPLVAWRFFRAFFIPDSLSADTDHTAIAGIFHYCAWLGFLFVIALVAVAVWCSRKQEWRPAAFGLWWFLLAFLPAAVFPVAEVENDHRMYFLFVGLAIAASWTIARFLSTRGPERRLIRVATIALCSAELGIFALATAQRNEIWRTEESLWYDVTVKSPRNGRGMMNYAATQKQKGDFARALVYLEKARALGAPADLVEADLGAVTGELRRDAEAERHFLRAIEISPHEPSTRQLYARWLDSRGRSEEAMEQAKIGARANPDNLESIYALLGIYAKEKMWRDVRAVAEGLLKRFPSDVPAKAYLLMLDPAAPALRTPGNFLYLSVLHFEAARFEDAIGAAKEAVKLRPRYPEAYNNIAAAYRKLEEWDHAAEAAREALLLRPQFDQAQKNLTLALAHQ
jgi:Flp pilus assembly protein TadD